MKILKTGSIIIAMAGLIGTLAWLFVQNLVPSGVLVLHWQPGEANAFVGPLVPESRLAPLAIAHDGTPYQTMEAEPVNFNMRVPVSFDAAKVSVTMAGDPAIVELGGLASRTTWTYDLRPGLNSVIDDLGWPAVYGKGLALYQREKEYSTVDEFLLKPGLAKTAVYRADANFAVKIPGYVPSGKIKTYSTAFRGATTIKAYLQNEPLSFVFKVQDVNRHDGADGFEAVAYLNGERIARAQFADDGNVSANGKLSPLRELRLYTDKPVTGTVRVDMPAGDDIVFRQTATTQQKFVFPSRFYAADNAGYGQTPASFAIVTNGKRLYATTSHPEAFQTLAVGAGSLAVDDLNKPFTISIAEEARQKGSVDIVSAYGDLRMETAGVFAFTRENLWSPDLQPLTWETDVDKDGIDRILTPYVIPKRGEWRTVEATFDLNKLSAAEHSYNFAISAPGLETQKKELRLAAIDIELRKPPLTFMGAVGMLSKLFKK